MRLQVVGQPKTVYRITLRLGRFSDSVSLMAKSLSLQYFYTLVKYINVINILSKYLRQIL